MRKDNIKTKIGNYNGSDIEIRIITYKMEYSIPYYENRQYYVYSKEHKTFIQLFGIVYTPSRKNKNEKYINDTYYRSYNSFKDIFNHSLKIGYETLNNIDINELPCF